MQADKYSAIENLIDKLASLQAEYVKTAGDLLVAVEDDITASSYYLEELNVKDSDAPEMACLNGGGEVLPPLLTPKRKFMSGVKQVVATTNGDAAEFRKSVRAIAGTAKYKFSRGVK